ncbi:MAG: class I tRNA ligase family protein, partial [Pseudomonadota bacterium]
WESPWGRGRPGWHIECSAMSRALLGDSFDIHGGGNDLIFPHHENEIAQSRCAHPEGDFAHYWLHNEMLQVEGKKMSKSLGNFFTVRDLLDQGIPGEVIRFVFLSTHYRKPMDWTAKKAADAEKTLRKWYGQVNAVDAGEVDPNVITLLADDLNTPGTLAECHRLSAEGDGATLKATLQFLGLMAASAPAWATAPSFDFTSLETCLSDARTAAMETKDFAPVDALKAALMAAGVEVRMSKEGVELIAGPEFDAGKLPKA